MPDTLMAGFRSATARLSYWPAVRNNRCMLAVAFRRQPRYAAGLAITLFPLV